MVLRSAIAAAGCLVAVSAVPLSTSALNDYRQFLQRGGEDDAQSSDRVHLTVNWMAPFFSQGGYSSEAHAFLRGLTAEGHRIAVSHHGDSIDYKFLYGLSESDYSTVIAASRVDSAPSESLCVCHSEPGAWQVSTQLPALYDSGATCPMLGCGYTVGRTMFETDRLPGGWAARLNGMDEVWVPTAFAARIFAAGGVDPQKLLVVPEAVDTNEFSPEVMVDADTGERRASSHLPRRRCPPGVAPGSSAACPYRFLSVGKFERRKGFDILLRAYLTAFEAGEHVELWILTAAYHSSKDFEAGIANIVKNEIACASPGNNAAPPATRTVCIPADKARNRAKQPMIGFLSGIPQRELPLVYGGVDAFVLASRGEGWGRPHVEAMAMQLPVIATHWSGPSEYMTANNSYPLKHSSMAPIPDGAFKGHLQAEPDAAELARLLRHVVAHPDEAAAKAQQARQDVAALYSPAALGRFLAAHFARIERVVYHRRSDSAAEWSLRVAAAEAALGEAEQAAAVDAQAIQDALAALEAEREAAAAALAEETAATEAAEVERQAAVAAAREAAAAAEAAAAQAAEAEAAAAAAAGTRDEVEEQQEQPQQRRQESVEVINPPKARAPAAEPEPVSAAPAEAVAADTDAGAAAAPVRSRADEL